MKKIFSLGLLLLLCCKVIAQNEPNDCVNAITVCGNGAFSSNAQGIGDVQEVSSCGGLEHNSLWLKINIVQAGTLGFNLIPDDPSTSVDYDFWVFGPNASCGSLGSALRCSTTNPDAANLNSNHTGMNGSTLATQGGPGGLGTGYVRWLTVSPGQSYYIAIDRPEGEGGFTLEWIGSAMAGTGAFEEPPLANNIEEVRTCSTAPNIGIFDLGSLRSQINADTTGNTINFFSTLANAVDNISPLSDIISNTVNPQQIYARVTNNTTGCFTTTDFLLRVYPVPDVDISAPPAICEGDNTTITFTGTPNANFHYTINGGPAQAAVLDASGSFALNQVITATTTYALVDVNITNSNNEVICSQTLSDSVTVTISQVGDVTVTTNSPLCGTGTGIFTFTGPPNATVEYTVQGITGTQSTVLNASGESTISILGLTANTNYSLVSVTNSTDPFCSKPLTATGTIVVNSPPQITNPQSMRQCAAGLGIFDLESNNPVISGGNSTYTITYHLTEVEAQQDINALTSPYQSISNNQLVYVRVESAQGSVCVGYTTLTLMTVTAPTIVEPTALEACEVDNAGFATFDLTQRNAEVLNGQSGLTITWYPTLSDAQLNVNAIPDPSSHYSNSTVVYAGVVQEGTTTGCRSIVPLTLIVHPRPAVPVVSQLTLCDDNNSPDGIEEFDLTLNDDAARGGDASLTVQYYLTQADAQNNTSPITTPQTYPNATPNQQTIWVGVATTFGCRSVSSFTILVNPLPVLSTDPADFIATECEELPGEADFDLDEIATAVTAGSASYVVYFYQTQAQALAGGADFEPGPTYLSGDADIWARVINPTTNCVRVARVELNVIPAPIATTPAPIAECDDNNDGFARFNLVPTMQAIEAAIADVTVSAFETQSDADLNVNAIPSPGAYDNIVAGTQTLYLRVQSDLTDCYDTVTLVLIVNPRPDAHSPAQPYALCDDGTSDSDGIAHFNLNSQSAEILAGLDPAQYTVDYYTDAAATPAGLIGTPGNYPSASATVYARVTNTATGCFYIVPVRLVVNALPVLITNEYSYSLCDTTLPANKETFDLTTTIDKFITDENLNGVKVSFHTTLADAQGNTNALTDQQAQAYENTSQVQSLYVRFTVTTTGCFRLGYLDIRVEPQPVLTLPSQDELTVCDTDGNGIGEFNLEALKEGLANGDASLVITFHLTAEEALSGANPIGNTTDYRNDHPGTQTLWVRAVSGTTGCFNTTPFPVTLIVTPAPQAPKLQDITLCDDTDNNGQDGALRTDLTVYETQIKEAVAPVEVTITYYLSQADSDAGSNGIASPARHIARDGQVIWVRVENTAGCYSLTSFTIHINKPHQLVTPTPLAVCNEALPNDGIAEFNLTQKDDEILGPDGVGMDYVVDYFTTDPKTDSTAVAIADPKAYVNTDSNGAAQNPRTIWVRVTTTQGCVSYTTLTIRVLPLPVPNFNPAPLEVCDQDTTEVGSEPFDLTLAQDDIRNNGTNYLFSYYTTEEDAQAGTNAIPDPTSHNSASGSVWVRVEANTNNPSDLRCFQIVELELIVNPLPPIADLADYGICNDTPASPTAFNLKEYVETALGGNTGTIYTIGYFSDAALTTRATPITGYVVTGSATVYIEVVNNDTGCRIVKELELIVEQQAVANPVADPAAVCDTDDQNDGRASGWDLTLLAPEVLGAQDPAVFLVSYYDIDPSTVPAPQPIQDPENYTNQTPESQVIWIVVTNSDTVQDTPCSATTTVTLRVERRAEPVITTADGSDTVCIEWGASEGELELNSGVVPNGHTYLWYKDGVLLTDSDDSGSYIAKTGGVYTVVVTGPAPLECVSDESAGFTVIESGQASAIGQGYYVTNYFSDNQTITVTIEGNGEYTYQLDNGPRQESPVFTNVSPGYHTVTVWDEKTDFPCQELVLNGVSIVDYPNFFTPNGDGFHDTWNIIGLSGTGSVIYIFDRYGKLIKQISPDLESSGWDGTLNGTPVPATDYWFTVTYPEFDGTTTVTKEFKSHFSLKR
ncbi:hypothetical protein AMR72_03215 [Flavobacterium psychrophilum]|nr:hypothetical protein AMR72_03215 [Flavobacterium psychrophilum]AOE51604.1 hypothetical protein ALW18_03215 [Flavobacterium psychrophilum]